MFSLPDSPHYLAVIAFRGLVDVTIASAARIVSVSGTAALIADAPLSLTNMYSGTIVFAGATVDGFFNPTRLVLDGGPLSLTAAAVLHTNGTTVAITGAARRSSAPRGC